tara:strand:- start:34 stop:429 length:396 start_codon:yes stop_codon:yes gene_type:complete
MFQFFNKYNFIFYLINLIVIVFYLFPGSLIGCFLYSNCQLEPQIEPNFLISTNHMLIFFILSLIGFFTFRKINEYRLLMIYLIFLCFFLEVMHNFIPERSFEYKDLLGNFIGIVIGAIAIIFFKKYENNKN